VAHKKPTLLEVMTKARMETATPGIFKIEKIPKPSVLLPSWSSSVSNFGIINVAATASARSAPPVTAKGKTYPPSSNKAPPTDGPNINPRPKNVSSEANVVATESGNSQAVIVNVAVIKEAAPKASMILSRNDKNMKGKCPSILSKNPNKMQDKDVVNIPALKIIVGPTLLIYLKILISN
jgi:hypothetical protein